MARAPSPTLDPAADAAALLRRLGFATLLLALPVGALVARRGAVVLVPVGVVLLIIAAALDGSHRSLRDSVAKVATSLAGLAGALLLAWCGLSLLWTPFQDAASDRFLSIIATIGVGFAGYLALPDRMRSANLYLLPIGAGLAAVVAIILPSRAGFRNAARTTRRHSSVASSSWWFSCGLRSLGCVRASATSRRSCSRSPWRSRPPSVRTSSRSSASPSEP